MDKQYIERGEAIKEIESLSVTVTGLRAGKNLLTRYAKHYKDSVVKILSDVPAADVAPIVHGEWIFDFELDGSNFYKCSVCGRQEVLLAKESTDEYFPYCHCGAKMDGGKHDG